MATTYKLRNIMRNCIYGQKETFVYFCKNQNLFDHEKIFIILIVHILMLILFRTGNNYEQNRNW